MTRPMTKFTFAELVEGDEDDFPTIARAAANTVPADNVTVEWFDGEKHVNYTQIIRWAYMDAAEEGSDRDTAMMAKHPSSYLGKFLRSIEETLIYGIPSEQKTSGGLPIRTCGGWKWYINERELEDDDLLILRPLREPVLIRNDYDRYGIPLDTLTWEWLTEFSLEVHRCR